LKKFVFRSLVILLAGIVLASCTSTRKKGELSKTRKLYENTTAYYNGYWNAKEIVRESMISMRAANVDNYNDILEVEDFVSLPNPKMAKLDMDKVIEKVTTQAQIRDESDWVDDCYVMMARAQYLKHEYETAEETLEYFEEDFNPKNPYGRNFRSKKLTGKAAKRMKEIQRKEILKEKEEAAEKKEEIKEEKAKTVKEKREKREEEAKAKKKAKEKERKERAKAKKKGQKVPPKEKPAPKDPVIDKKPEVIKPAEKKVDEKKESKEEDKVIKAPKVEEDRSAYPEGKLWLAKTYIKRENFFGAESILNRLSEIVVNEDVKKELPITYASLYIKQGLYDKALPKLLEAIDIADSKNLKGRYAFIAGQIYAKTKQYDEAYKYFDIAERNTKSDKMQFMAEMATFTNKLLSGNLGKDKAIEQLEAKAKDEKYLDYTDQIYYTIGMMEVNQGNTEKGISYLSKSIQANTGDGKMKAEAYYTIADIYYKKDDYLNASLYFDSTGTVMNKEDERYPLVQKYITNLKDIAVQLEIIKTNDSLIYFASLPPDDLKKIASRWLAKSKPATSPQLKSSTLGLNTPKSTTLEFGTSKFFAYNKQNAIKGKEEFIKKWGRRVLEDDWRRSSKASAVGGDTEPTTAGSEDKNDDANKAQQDEDLKKFMRDLPSNPIKKQELEDKTMNAMFVLGKLYRDKIEAYTQSANTLEGMHTRFGATPYELESFYYIYLDYLSLNDAAKSAEYKKKITQKYPDSKYATILNDPEYFVKADKTKKPDDYYENAYTLFQKGRYKEAVEGIDQSVKLLQDENPYAAKFALLRAMCLGSTQGKDAYIQGLMALISTYPNTPEQLKAKEILRFLGGDKNAFSTLNVQDVDKIYKKDMDEKHYVAVVSYDLQEDALTNVKIAISEYNKKNFKNERLQLGDNVLSVDKNSQIILVRVFENGFKAMDFYKKVEADKVAFLGAELNNVDILPISQTNYRKMLSEANTNTYRIFFEQQYLESK
jgi:tetratricopeptide (TPR) repeat protein